MSNYLILTSFPTCFLQLHMLHGTLIASKLYGLHDSQKPNADYKSIWSKPRKNWLTLLANVGFDVASYLEQLG